MVLRYNTPPEGKLIGFVYEELQHDYGDPDDPKVEADRATSSGARFQSSLQVVLVWCRNAVAPARAAPNVRRRFGVKFRRVHHSSRVDESAR